MAQITQQTPPLQPPTPNVIGELDARMPAFSRWFELFFRSITFAVRIFGQGIRILEARVKDNYALWFDGAVATPQSPTFDAPVLAAGSIKTVGATLGTAGGGSTVVDILVNGSPRLTLTIPAAATQASTDGDETTDREVVKDDVLSYNVTTAGGGAADLRVEVGVA